MVGVFESVAALGPVELLVTGLFVAVWVAVLGGMVASMCSVVIEQYRSEERSGSVPAEAAD